MSRPEQSSHYTIVFPATAGSTQTTWAQGATVGITELGAEGDILWTNVYIQFGYKSINLDNVSI